MSDDSNKRDTEPTPRPTIDVEIALAAADDLADIIAGLRASADNLAQVEALLRREVAAASH